MSDLDEKIDAQICAQIRDGWRRRYAGVALEGLLAAGAVDPVLPHDDVIGRTVRAAARIADMLLDELDKPKAGPDMRERVRLAVAEHIDEGSVQHDIADAIMALLTDGPEAQS